MGLLRFVKSAAAAPPERWEQEAGKHGLEVVQGEAKTEGDHVVLAGSDAAEKIAPATDDPADALAASEAAESRFYTVQRGDTLGKIAAAEYGHGHGGEYHRIFEAKKPLLSDPGQIYPGQVLRIPALSD